MKNHSFCTLLTNIGWRKTFGLPIAGILLFYICIDEWRENGHYHLPIIYLLGTTLSPLALKFALNHLDRFLFIHRYLSIFLIAFVFIGSFIELNEQIFLPFLSCIAIYISSSLLVFSHKAVEIYNE